MAEQEFYSILTIKGKEKEMKCLNGECAYDIWEIAVGDGNGSHYEPEVNQTALKNECWRGLVACCENEDETRYAIAHIPANVGGFTIREIGAFDKEGNLLIIGKCAKNEKKLPESGDIKQLSYRVDLSVINELVLPFIIDPSINTASINYCDKHYQKLNEKSKPNGYAPLDNEAKVPLEHLPSTFIPFCFNSGPVDENGNAALLELSTAQAGVTSASDELDNVNTTASVTETIPPETEDRETTTVTKQILTLKSPAVYTDGSGRTTAIVEDLTLDVTDLEPGEYSLRVAENNSIIEFFTVNADVYKQKIPPENPKDGDLWQNLSVAPNIVYKYKTSTQEWLPNCNEVEAGKYTKPEITEHPDLSGGGGV